MSAAREHRWRLRLRVRTPLATGGVENVALGIDTALLRDHEGRAIISGPQLRGLFRHFAQAMLDEGAAPLTKDDFARWFGLPGRQLFNAEEMNADIYIPGFHAESPADVLDTPERARCHFHDLILKEGEARDTITRIRIDEKTGAVRRGALLVMEQPAQLAKLLRFTGEVRLFGDDAEAARFREALGVFLRFLRAVGGVRSAGFGEVVEADFSEQDSRALLPPPQKLPGVVTRLRIRFDTPFLVDARLFSGNLLRGGEVIPGAVIKMALAERLRLAGKENDPRLKKALSHIVIRHAMPVTAGETERPRMQPLSVVRCNDSLMDWWDCAAGEAACDDFAFAPDWKPKDHEMAAKYWPRSDVAHVTRTRTAIEPGRNVAQEHHLFNHQPVSPKGLEWLGELMLPADADEEMREGAEQLLAMLTKAALPIGKTQAEMRVEAEEARLPQPEPERAGNDEIFWRITLQTPALLLDMSAVERLEQGTDLRKVYREYFADVLGDAKGAIDWEDSDLLVAHVWHGGHRAARRPATGDKGKYYPWLVTKPGSVFRLKQKEGIGERAQNELREKFAEWLRTGLPLPTNIMSELDDPERDFRHCPFPPRAGYGEVRIDAEDVRRAQMLAEKEKGQ